MSRFQPIEAFRPAGDDLELLPFRFERLSDDEYLVSNMVGDFVFLDGGELRRLVALDVQPDEPLYARAAEALLLRRKGQRAPLQLLAMRQRSRSSFMRSPTGLHILVVTLRCEHSCPYCQVSRRSADRERYDMSLATAVRAVEVALSSPSPHIKLEFQGGEPLLNFDLIEQIVPIAKARAKEVGKSVDFVITSNLALLGDAVLDFCKTHGVLLSTSLDGPADLHNRNRPRPGGNSHALVVEGIRRAQTALGKERVGALMTTTQASLDRVEEIVDEYVGLGLDGVFLRPLSPYGFAVKTKQFFKYDSHAWLQFYERGLRYILRLNREGLHFPEFYATLLTRRMLSDVPTGYVDLRSPAGIGLGALVYNYDGKVFASDEGRMLAEMGDRTFELGDLASDDYQSLILSDKLIDLVGRSLTQCAPQCSSCAFEPHCGADPVYHHATQGDPVGIKPLSEFCTRQKTIMGLLARLLAESPEDAAILRRWAA